MPIAFTFDAVRSEPQLLAFDDGVPGRMTAVCCLLTLSAPNVDIEMKTDISESRIFFIANVFLMNEYVDYISLAKIIQIFTFKLKLV